MYKVCFIALLINNTFPSLLRCIIRVALKEYKEYNNLTTLLILT